MSLQKLDLSALSRSITALRKVVRMDLDDEVVRDAAIKRFEFTYGLSWKMMRRHLQWSGLLEIEAVNRKELYRAAARISLISDPEAWFAYHEARNLTSHAYDEDNARKVAGMLKVFLKDATALLRNLKEFHA